MRKGSDYLFGRKRRGYGSGFGFGRERSRSSGASSGMNSKSAAQIAAELRLAQLASLSATSQSGVVLDKNGNPIVNSGKDCNTDQDCGVLFCKINPHNR